MMCKTDSITIRFNVDGIIGGKNANVGSYNNIFVAVFLAATFFSFDIMSFSTMISFRSGNLIIFGTSFYGKNSLLIGFISLFNFQFFNQVLI